MKISKSINDRKKLSLLGVLLFAGLLYAVSHTQTFATTLESVSGWAWGGTPDTTGGYDGAGWISTNDTDIATPGVSYGVDVPLAGGPVSGYAWNEHYGWLSFTFSDLAGCSPALAPATQNGGALSGGARFIAFRDAGANAGGFDGCVSLSGSNYGVTTDGATLSGYAWSSDLGWINMNGLSLSYPDPVLLGTGCVIPEGSDSCLGTFTWNIVSAADPNLHNQTQNLPCSTNEVAASEPCSLTIGDNTIQTRDGGAVREEITVSASCAAGAIWHPTNNLCVTAPQPPVIQIAADPSTIRNGQSTEIAVEVTASDYDFVCTLYGIEALPITVNHIADPAPQRYEYTTKVLTSDQIIQVTCTALGVSATEELRIRVLPTIEEV